MKKLLGFAILCAISSGCVHAQQTFNSVRMKAPTNGGTVGSTDYYENGNVYRVRVQAGPSGSLTSNLNWKFPYTADSAGDCLVSLGGGQWNPGACGLTPPVTISGSTAGNILTVTQSGAGDAIRSNGPLYANGLTTLNDVVLLTGKKIQFTAGGTYMSQSVTNRLDWRDSGSNLRMSLDYTNTGTNGVRLLAPTLVAFPTVTTDYGLYVGGIPSQSENIFRVDATNGGTNYLNISPAGAISGLHAQNVGTGDSPSVLGLTATGGVIAVTGTGNASYTASASAFGDAYAHLSANGGSNIWDVLASGTANTLLFKRSGSTLLTLGSTGALSGTHIQSLGAGDNPTFNNLTIITSAALGIATGTSISVTGGGSFGSGAATISSGGQFTGGSVIGTGSAQFDGNVQAGHGGTGGVFINGGTNGITQTITVANSTLVATCTITFKGGIVTGTTC